jgi:hypothetical protein
MELRTYIQRENIDDKFYYVLYNLDEVLFKSVDLKTVEDVEKHFKTRNEFPTKATLPHKAPLSQ